MTDKLKRIRQRMLLPAGAVAIGVAAVGDGLLHSGAVFAVGFVATLAALAGMVVTLHLEARAERAETPDVSEISTASGRGDAS